VLIEVVTHHIEEEEQEKTIDAVIS